jgi:predicted TIM-barrel fold metal-dependent hydrolase
LKEKVMAIDLHSHFIPEELAAELRKRDIPPFIRTQDDGSEIFQMPHGVVSFSQSYSDMDARRQFMTSQGVQRQVLSLPGLFGIDSIAPEESLPLIQIFNNQVSELCKMYPGTFSGLASLPMADMSLAVKEYKRARDDLGLIGAILPNNCFMSEDHAKMIAPIFKITQEIGGHLFVHPSRRPDEVPEVYKPITKNFDDFAPERLALTVQHNVGHCMVTLLFSDFLDAYPGVTLHVANLGGTLPMVIERMDNVTLTRTPNQALPSSRANRVHVDSSSLGSKSLELAAAIFGADRIVLGTDCPIFLTERSLNAVTGANISDFDKKLILTGNAETLLASYI